jgi:hypothetical protein
MPRKSLRPELNRIRAWVRQGRTDAWIAHQLEVTVQQIQAFRRDQDLEPDSAAEPSSTLPDYDDEIDLRAEDDALIAAALDAELAEAAAAEAAAAEAAAAEAAALAAAAAEAATAEAAAAAEEETEDGKPKRRRTRRGGRSTLGRRAQAGPLEATFDHGEEGYGLWLDPAVQDDPIYAEYWAGHRPVEVTIEEDQIVIRRSGAEGALQGEAE